MCGCNKSINNPSQVVTNNLVAVKQRAIEEISMIQDENMVLCRYMHPNRGNHVVVGQGVHPKIKYGYRAHGDTFLVHKEDIRAQPHLFVPVDTAKDKETKINEPVPEPVQEFDVEGYLKKVREKWNNELDLQSLPGVTPTIAENMKNSGLTTYDAIVGLGASGLQDAVKGIGEAKAEMIIAFLEAQTDE